MKTILIVDDKLSLVRMLQDYLSSEGYRTVVADNGRSALFTARHAKPDLILLDLMMPELDGYGFMDIYRKEAQIPIIVLTSKLEKDSAIRSLELGADDYIIKPFDLDEVNARIRAVLRRYDKGHTVVRMVRVADLELDPEQQVISKAGRTLALTRSEYGLLSHFMENPGKTFSRAELLDHIDGGGVESLERTVDVHIRKLRVKLGDDSGTPKYIETVFGAGYRLSQRTLQP